MMLRFHTQTGGATLTAQQPENNVVRTSLQALAAVLGGTQSLHTNSLDEALALPTEEAASRAADAADPRLRDGVADTVDPLGGSYYVERSPTSSRLRARWLEQVEARGGAVTAIENGFWRLRSPTPRTEDRNGRSSHGERVVVGVNRFPTTRRRRSRPSSCSGSSAEETAQQIERLARRSAPRGTRRRVDAALAVGGGGRTRGPENLLLPMREALRLRATLGEASDVLRRVFGEYRPTY